MKQYKTSALNRTKAALATAQQPTTRQEIDEKVKSLTKFIEKNPKKAAEIFKHWLIQPVQSQKNKKAA